MNLSELKQQVDLEKFVVYHKYSIRKDKTTKKWPAYTNGNETIFIHDAGDIKLYFKPDGDRGTVVDFCLNRPELLQNFSGTPIEKVKQLLHQFLHIPQETIIIENRIQPFEEHQPFSIPKNHSFEYISDCNFQHLTYLKSRGINDSTLRSPCFKNYGLFYNKEYGYINIAFPIYNTKGKIEGLDIRNFNIKLFARDSNKSECIWISNFNFPKHISIGESPIDMMSLHQIHYPGDKNHQYIATEGNLTIGQLKFICKLIKHWNKKNSNLQINLAFDSDLAGSFYTSKILLSLMENRAMWPMYSNADQKKYENITNMEFIGKVTQNPNIKTILHVGKYHLIYKHDIDTLRFISHTAIQCLSDLKIKYLIPKAKDWNDDLQTQLTRAPNITETNTINIINTTILKSKTMEKFNVNELPLDIFAKMGLDFEKMQKNANTMYRLLNGKRSELTKTFVSDPYGRQREEWSKFRLYRDPTDQVIKVYIEYAQPRLTFDKYFHNLRMSEEQEQLIRQFGELGEPVILQINNKPIECLVGADKQLNTLQYTPTNCVFIPDRHYNINFDDADKNIMKYGGCLLKEDVQKGNLPPAAKVIFYSNTYDGVISVTPTPELLERIRQQEEKRNSLQKSEKTTEKEEICTEEKVRENIAATVKATPTNTKNTTTGIKTHK